jgi:cephalosporin hydroxylase
MEDRMAEITLTEGTNRITLNEEIITNMFHHIYYDSRVWERTHWLGFPLLKCPLDTWIYQEIIYETRPDVIIETGTFQGGSALFMAFICDMVGNGEIVTIDIAGQQRPAHPRITYLTGSSTSPEIVDRVAELIKNKEKRLVILDSDHSREHVLNELRIYGNFVSQSSYLIVEDTNINGHPVRPDFGPGPMEAVEEFLRGNDLFVIDKAREKFFLTQNPNGYLRRVK